VNPDWDPLKEHCRTIRSAPQVATLVLLSISVCFRVLGYGLFQAYVA